MELDEKDIIYLTPTKYKTLEGDEELEEVKIKDFLNKIKNNLRNKKTKVEVDDDKYVITMEDKKYGLIIDDIDYSMYYKLNKLHEKYLKIKQEDEYEDSRHSKYLKEEIKHMNVEIVKNSHIEFLNLLRVPIGPAGLLMLILGGVFKSELTLILGIGFFMFGGTDFVLGLDGDNDMFINIPKRFNLIKEDIFGIRVRKRELEKRESIHKIQELNKKDNNNLNVDTKKEEQIKKLLKRMKEITSDERYASIVEELYEKKEKLAIESPSIVRDEISVSQPREAVGYAFQGISEDQGMRKVLRR